MDQKWLLSGVILTALSLSGCNNSSGPSAKNADNIKAAKASTHAVAETPGSRATTARDTTALPANDISGRSQPSPQHAENGGGEDTGRAAGQPAAAVASNNPEIARRHAPKVPKMGGFPTHGNATEPALASAENHGGVPVNARGVRACGVLDFEERPVLGAVYPGISGIATAADLIRHVATDVGIQPSQTGAVLACAEQPVLGAAYPGISGAEVAADLEPRNPAAALQEIAEATRIPVHIDTQPVLGAAYPGISGAEVAADLEPRNPTTALQEIAEATRIPVHIDTQPVLGAAYPGISGAEVAADLEPRNPAAALVEIAEATRIPIRTDTQPVLGAAYPGISGAQLATDIEPRNPNQALLKIAEASGRLPATTDTQPVLGAAYPGVSGAALANLAELVSYHAKVERIGSVDVRSKMHNRPTRSDRNHVI